MLSISCIPMEAVVYKSTGSWYSIFTGEGVFLRARIRGKLRIDDIASTNPIAVGDIVQYEVEVNDPEAAIITGINKRHNYITRTSPHNRHQQHIVASNIDQTLLFATIKNPKTSLGFIDRFLITAEAYHIPAIIVFNKTDLLSSKDKEKLDEITQMYEKIGYTVLQISITHQVGLEQLKNMLTNKTTLISGHSGVGKSSFINWILPELALKVQDVSGWSGKGMHTTTFAEMYDLSFGGRLIDTPGIRELGLFDIDRQVLSHYFPEMRALLQSCQYNNCIHENEPGCAIKNAVQQGHVHIDRYVNYMTILESISSPKY